MISDRNRPSAAFWITVALVVMLVGYPLSFGPACWVTSRMNAGTAFIPKIYRPIMQGLSPNGEFSPDGSGRLDRAIRGYASWGAPVGWNFYSDISEDGSSLDWKWNQWPSNRWGFGTNLY
jgi:hypothetical protein